ncbi:FMN-dependent NADH-azoreductase [Flavobacterium sp. WW92]|uniref:FMN-dependent NADH-azoreductase n=1 Tax=unclassified Flavobacterium TaxID=196869 RepID=UPI002225AA4E|nr:MULTISPECIES: FMN-dependent NADH-azoreductase [unclassified Flavobacterium]WDO11472.1 FMN-dependent NADH-azoreductase [Flavobacterium sp. WW92]
MKKILHIISSPRGDASMSIKLGNAIIEKLQAAYPDSQVKEHDLLKDRFPHLDEMHIASFFTPEENRSAQNKEAIRPSDEAIQEITDADIIVIGTPLFNFGIPSSLKAWIDHIARAGVTFKYDENGPEGLVKGKKVYVAMASGGIYSDGPMASYDFAVPYLRSALGFLGMNDITVYRVEGTMIPTIQDTALEKAVDGILIS